jgi:hypothetical protein
VHEICTVRLYCATTRQQVEDITTDLLNSETKQKDLQGFVKHWMSDTA